MFIKIDKQHVKKKQIMESIVKFSFPHLEYECVLNPRGRPSYGSIEHLLNKQAGIPSTVGLPDGTNVLLTDIRNSTKIRTVVNFILDTHLINDRLMPLLSDDNEPQWSNSAKYDIIQYKKGGYFKEHSDKKIKPNHYATLLIFPPALGTLEHTGGELIFEQGRSSFKSSENREWTFIAFHTETVHECLEITSGNRVVLKTELFSLNPTKGRMNNDTITDGNIFVD
jgi:hypothetical protein